MTNEPPDLPDDAADEERGTVVDLPRYRIGHATALLNTWYPVAHASRVRRRPIARELFGEPIVLWRDTSGELRVMEDRCAHRRMPLSEGGRVTAEGLQCRYHGWTFDGGGRCTKIPSIGEEAPPHRFGVATHHSVTRYGLVWVWRGDIADASVDLLPAVPFIDAHGRAPIESSYVYDSSSDLVVENALDLTHLDFVHGTVLGDPIGGPEEVTVEHTDEILTMHRISDGRRPPKLMAPFWGFPDRQDLRQSTSVYLRSNCIVGTLHYDPPGWSISVVLPNTPEGEQRTRSDFSMVVTGPQWFRALVHHVVGPIATRQDNRVLKAQARNYLGNGADRQHAADKSVRGDAPTLKYRSLRRKLVERQATGGLSYSPRWRDAAVGGGRSPADGSMTSATNHARVREGTT